MNWLHPHIPFIIAFALGAGARTLAGITYQPALLLLGDSVAYLNDAVHLRPPDWHPAMYSIFLWPFQHLHITGVVPPLQHILGLGAAVALYLLLLRLGLRPWVAAVACLPLLLDGYQIMMEQFIVSEAFFLTLVVTAFVVLLWRERVSWVTGAVVASLISLATLTRVVGLVLIPIVLVYVCIRRRSLAAIAATVVAAAVPLVLYASWYNSAHGSFKLTGNTWITLYGRVAPFADCSNLELPQKEAILCDPRPESARPGPNYYLFHPMSPVRRLPVGEANDLFRRFSTRIIMDQPGRYLRLVAGDFAHYFVPGRYADRWQDPLAVYRLGQPLPGPPWVMLMPDMSIRQLYKRVLLLVNEHVPLPNPEPSVGLHHFMRRYQDVAVTPGPLLALAALLGLLGLFGPRRPGERSLRAEGVVLSVSGLALLLTPSATAVFDYRYLLPALPLLSAAGVIGATSLYRRLSGPSQEARASGIPTGTHEYTERSS